MTIRQHSRHLRSGRTWAHALRRRAGVVARVVLVAFALMQWAVPAFACMELVEQIGTVTVADGVAAGAPCSEHVHSTSLLCFKHCHPDEGTFSPSLAALPALAPAPAFALAIVDAHAGSACRQSLYPGLPPPRTITYCRLLR